MANPLMVKGNKLALRRRPRPPKSTVASMLAQFEPRMVEIIQQRLTAGDAIDQWQTVKELMPYVWSRKPAQLPVPSPDAPAEDLNTYLIKRARYGLDREKPA
jgi:hypothetical protein